MAFRLSLTSKTRVDDGKNGGRTLAENHAPSSGAALSLPHEGNHDVLLILKQKAYLGGLLRGDEGCYATKSAFPA